MDQLHGLLRNDQSGAFSNNLIKEEAPLNYPCIRKIVVYFFTYLFIYYSFIL